MSRYKKTFEKSSGSLFSDTRWYCTIYDRKKDEEYYAGGSSKKEAEENAWDNVYNNNPYSNNYGSEQRDSTLQSKPSKNSVNDGWINFAIWVFTIGVIFYFFRTWYLGFMEWFNK